MTAAATCFNRFLRAAFLLAASGAAGPLWAEETPPGFRLCNETLDVFNAAFGDYRDDTFETRGWWVIAPGQCARITERPLSSRFVYVLATDPFGRVMLDGATPMCAATGQFDIRGDEDCLSRGYLEARYMEVDTKEAQGFTLSVYPDAQ